MSKGPRYRSSRRVVFGALRRSRALSLETFSGVVAAALGFLASIGLHHAFGTGKHPTSARILDVVAAVAGLLVFLALDVAVNAILEYHDLGKDFQPFAYGPSTSNVNLELGVQRPIHLFGVRCVVLRSREDVPTERSAERIMPGLYVPGGAFPLASFGYPSSFAPSDWSTPEKGESCTATWFVRAVDGGPWVSAGRPIAFDFGLDRPAAPAFA